LKENCKKKKSFRNLAKAGVKQNIPKLIQTVKLSQFGAGWTNGKSFYLQ
jgi:hypothetical protein